MSLLHNKRQRDDYTNTNSHHKAIGPYSVNGDCYSVSASALTSEADRLNALTDKDFELGMMMNMTIYRLKCSFCNKNILKDIKIICIQCEDQPIYCLDCLLKGSTTHHYHDYHVIDKMEFPLFTSNWSIKEEMKLLLATEKNGLDNWEDISDAIKTKTKEECEAHYYTFYYQSNKIKVPLMKDVLLKKSMNPQRGIPPGLAPGIGMANAAGVMPVVGVYPKNVIDENIRKDNEAKENRRLQEVLKNKGVIPQETLSKLSIIKGKKSSIKFNGNEVDKNKAANNNTKPGPIDVNKLIGYYPKRLEFDLEYLNEAELDICELEFYDDDTEEDKALKLRMIELYNKELDEREKRKRFVIERKLYDVKAQMKIESKLPKEEREIYNCLKPFARFLSPSQFNDLFEGIVLEKNLRQRINQLQRYKDKGCSTYEEILELEKEENRHKRNGQKDNVNVNVMLAETCGIGNKLKTFLIKSSTELEDNNIEREKEFVNRIGIPKQNYKEIKESIAKRFDDKNRDKDTGKDKEKEKKIKGNNLDRIVDYVFEYTSANQSKTKPVNAATPIQP